MWVNINFMAVRLRTALRPQRFFQSSRPRYRFRHGLFTFPVAVADITPISMVGICLGWQPCFLSFVFQFRHTIRITDNFWLLPTPITDGEGFPTTLTFAILVRWCGKCFLVSGPIGASLTAKPSFLYCRHKCLFAKFTLFHNSPKDCHSALPGRVRLLHW